MATNRKNVRINRKELKERTYLGCPLTNNRSAWCFRLCVPTAEGKGTCGRLAPHSMKSRIQSGIARHDRQKQIKLHLEKLERMYLAAPCNRDCGLGVRIFEGEAEIVIPVQEQGHYSGGFVDSAVHFKAMDNSAALAVNSMVSDVLVRTKTFNIHFLHSVSAGTIIARGRLLTESEGQYLAEAALTDSEGNEIARGNGVYVKSATRLLARTGYA